MSFRRNWRFLLLSLVAIGALAIFAACGGDDEGGGDEATPADGSPATGERIEGGTLRVQQIEPLSLDPHFSSFAQDISTSDCSGAASTPWTSTTCRNRPWPKAIPWSLRMA